MKRLGRLFSITLGAISFLSLTSCALFQDDSKWSELTKSGETALRSGELDKAEKLLLQAVAEAEKFGKEDHRVASSLGDLAAVYGARHDFTKATELSQRALQIDEKTYGPEHEFVGFDLSNYGTFLDFQGKHAEATPVLIRACTVREKALGPKHQLLALSLTNLGECYATQKQFADAESSFKKAIDIYHLNHNFGQLNLTTRRLGEIYDKQQKYKETEELLKNQVTMFDKENSATSAWTSVAILSLAKFYQQQEKYALEEPLLQRALAIQKKQLGEDNAVTLTTINNLAVVLFKEGKYAQAEPYFKMVMKVAESKKHLELLADTMNNYSSCLDKLGRKKEAVKMQIDSRAVRAKALEAKRNTPTRPENLLP